MLERFTYMLLLQRLGNYTEEDAVAKTLARYPYEPLGTAFRGFVFHDESWQWAMRLIYGDPPNWPSPNSVGVRQILDEVYEECRKFDGIPPNKRLQLTGDASEG